MTTMRTIRVDTTEHTATITEEDEEDEEDEDEEAGNPSARFSCLDSNRLSLRTPFSMLEMFTTGRESFSDDTDSG